MLPVDPGWPWYVIFSSQKRISLYFVDQIFQKECNSTKIPMNYMNYKGKIAEFHGVALYGG
jgi:hypothetical protein